MNVDDYQEWTKTTAQYPNDAALTYLALGLTGEAGEVANKIKKIIRDGRQWPNLDDNDAIIDELGDVCWYLAQLSGYLGVKLSTVMANNQLKLNQRKLTGTIKWHPVDEGWAK